MKLYFKPGACSLASHLILREVNADFELSHVDTDLKTTAEGEDYTKINENGYVPALQIQSGDVLTEGAAILQYIAEQNPGSGLIPAAGTLARARVQEYLNYTASELHKAFGPLFSSVATDIEKEQAKSNVSKKFHYLEKHLADGRSYLVGDAFSVADAYLFVVSNWANFVGIELTQWPHLEAFVQRVAERPSAQQAMRAEGLIK